MHILKRVIQRLLDKFPIPKRYVPSALQVLSWQKKSVPTAIWNEMTTFRESNGWTAQDCQEKKFEQGVILHTPVQNIRAVCPCECYLGWAIVYIIHSVGHMIPTQPELLKVSQRYMHRFTGFYVKLSWIWNGVVNILQCSVEYSCTGTCSSDLIIFIVGWICKCSCDEVYSKWSWDD
jgi:hypothetical protein